MACLVVGASACGGDPPPETLAPSEPPQLVLFVYDRSTSIPDHTLELAQQLTFERIQEMSHGDRIGSMQLLQLSLAEPPQRWSEQIPEREVQDVEIVRDSVARARFLNDARLILSGFAEPAGRSEINGTDILSTLHDVGEEVRAYPEHRKILYLFSDMLQSNRQIDMEGSRLFPPDDWVANASADGLLPDLSGVCVVVVGARVDTPASQRVKRFWADYFRTTGADFRDQNYMLRPVSLPVEPCS